MTKPINVYVTGMGIISAIGNNMAACFNSLSQCKTGIGKINYLDTIHKNDFVAGEVKLSNEELCKMAGIYHYNRSTLLSLIAAKEALENASVTDIKEARTGFISATTVGSMCYTEQHYQPFFDGINNKDFLDSYLGGIGSNDVARILGITDFVTTISTACSSAANAIMLGTRLIRNNVLDRVIVGGTDALSKFTLNGFNTLMILDKQWCRPFDEGRAGLNLGEGAAYLVLESEDQVKSENKQILARIAGYGNANDAWHATASSPEGQGAFMAMQQALSIAGISPIQIDYINTHGTGTDNNDLSEGIAMQRLFTENAPPFSSTKAYTGHTLAAAAAIEAVISILAIGGQMVFPCLNQTLQMKELTITPLNLLKSNVPLDYVMSNSFGFGGNCSSLIFAKN